MNNSQSKEILPTEKQLENKNVVENTTTTSNANEETKSSKVEETRLTVVTTPTESTKENNETKVEETKKEEDVISLTHLDKDFIYELMSIPTVSKEEYRLVTFIILWARRNGIYYEFDKKGNVYLTKGKVGNGEFYPCVTAHLDSVQQKHRPYAQVGTTLEVKTRVVGLTTKKHEIYVDGMGIGGDDKAGVLIGLSMFSHVDKLKACFFLEEETGCIGSKDLNKEWFKDVGYVMGYDSPDLNRAAYECSGVRLFSKDFFVNHMQKICEEHGLTKFFSEPYTDVKEIRQQTNIICMNFGSGYYNGHMQNEYCVLEDMDNACRMGHALIKHLGLKRYELEHKGSSWTRGANGIYQNNDEDEAFFKKLSGYSYYGGNYGGYYNGGTAAKTTTYSGGTSTTVNKTTTTVNKDNENLVEIETVEYITNTYDKHIEEIKKKIMTTCESQNLDFNALFADIFSVEIKF